MKKQFTIFLVLTFILGLIPVNFSSAITQNQINAEVQIVCTDGASNWFSGSGTIIDPKGIILTNKHVIEGAYKNTCFIGFIKSISQEPDFGTEGNYNLAEVKYYTATDDMDAAILYLNNTTNKIYPYINIWDSNSDTLQFGNKIEVIGFPSIGGSTITYTSGDFSGFGSKIDGTQNYLKSTSQVEHGNSGGAAYNLLGQFIGIPTKVIAGSLNSLSYILSINSIKKWLSNILGEQYQKQIIEIKPTIKNPTVNIQTDITPPLMFSADKIIFHSNETGEDIRWDNMFENDSNITVKWSDAVDKSGIDGYYVYFGANRSTNPVLSGVYTKKKTYNKVLDIPGIYFIMISARDKKGNISAPVIAQYNYKVYADWITNDPMQYLLVTNRPTYYYIYDYSNGIKGRLLKEIKFNSSKTQNITVASNNVLIEWNGAQNKDFITEQKVYFNIDQPWLRCGGDVYYNIKDKINMSYEEWDACVKKQYNEVKENNIISTNLQLNKSYGFRYAYYFTYEHHINEYAADFNPFTLTATKKNIYKESNSSIDRFKGYILLQTESRGEAWYVNPADGKRYYMRDGSTAYQMMRNFGIGIKNSDLIKIPRENEKNNYSSFVSKQKGKILLQVEDHGEAWYVNPKTGYRHYMGDGEAAYNLMRYYSAGITNKDLEKIPEGTIN